MTRPTVSISDREQFVKAAKHEGSSSVRVARTWATVVIEEEGRWYERPAIRFYYEVDVETVGGPMTWTFAEVVPLGEDGRVKGDSLEAQLEQEHLEREIMTSQSGSI